MFKLKICMFKCWKPLNYFCPNYYFPTELKSEGGKLFSDGKIESIIVLTDIEVFPPKRANMNFLFNLKINHIANNGDSSMKFSNLNGLCGW